MICRLTKSPLFWQALWEADEGDGKEKNESADDGVAEPPRADPPWVLLVKVDRDAGVDVHLQRGRAQHVAERRAQQSGIAS